MKTGIIVRSLNSGELSKLLLEQQKNIDFQIVNFILEIENPPIQPRFPINHINELWGFYNPVVTTCINTTVRAISIPSPPELFFYVWQLEWVGRNKWYNDYANIYANPKIKLIAKNDSDKKHLENCWGGNVIGIVENFNLKKIEGLIRGQKN